MAMFGSKKNTIKKEAPAKSKKAVAEVSKKESTNSTSNFDMNAIIKRPRITEKASMGSEKGVYAFEVSQNANKKTIAAAVRAMYNVTPLKIAIAAIPKKNIIVRGKRGVRKGGKKAYVYLAKGETIEFV
jgi:large subunit ribosomal protein L23